MKTFKRIYWPAAWRRFQRKANCFVSSRTIVWQRIFVNSVKFIKQHRQTVTAGLIIFSIPLLIRAVFQLYPGFNALTVELTEQELSQAHNKLRQEITRLERKLSQKTPSSNYLIINSSCNEFSLFKGTELVKQDKCSTGSYILLKGGNDQQWMFKTPKGEFRILGKAAAPVWRKPDWAFIEEGLPVPSANHQSRYERGALGDYALSLGDGYLIHGTLYQRFLGLPVTHGCIRLNDENLELVYNKLSVGSKVFIY